MEYLCASGILHGNYSNMPAARAWDDGYRTVLQLFPAPDAVPAQLASCLSAASIPICIIKQAVAFLSYYIDVLYSGIDR